MDDSDTKASEADSKKRKSFRESFLDKEAAEDDDDLQGSEDDVNSIDEDDAAANEDDDVGDDDDLEDNKKSRPEKKQLKRLRRGNKDELEDDDRELLRHNDSGPRDKDRAEGDGDDDGNDSDSFIEHDIPEEYMDDDDFAYSRREGVSEFQDVDNIFGDYEGLYSEYMVDEKDDSTNLAEEIKRKLKSGSSSMHDKIENYSRPQDVSFVQDDKPERYHLRLQGRREVQPDERELQAEWMADKLVAFIRIDSNSDQDQSLAWLDSNVGWPGSHIHRMQAMKDIEYEPNEAVVNAIKKSVYAILELIQTRHVEPPFIWTYRRDFIHHLIARKHLWMIVDWDEEWERIHKYKNEIKEKYSSIIESQKYASVDIDGELSKVTNELDIALHEVRRFQGYVRENEEVESELLAKLSRAGDNDLETDVDGSASEENRSELAKVQSEIADYRRRETACKEDMKRLKGREANLQQMKRQKPSIDPAYATLLKDKLFPEICYGGEIDRSTDALMLADISTFLRTLLTGTHIPEARSDAASRAIGSITQEEAINMKTTKTLRSKTAYMRYKESRSLRNFIDRFTVPVCEVGEALRTGFVPILPDTPEQSLDELAGEFLDEVCTDVKSVIQGAVTIVSEELGKEPSILKMARKLYHELATLTVELTTKGSSQLKTTDSLFSIAFAKNVKINELLDGRSSYNYAHLEQARKQGLITLAINIPIADAGVKSLFYSALKFDVLIGEHKRSRSSFATSWAKLMDAIVEETMMKILLPNFEREVRSELLKNSYENIAKEAAGKFGEMLSVGPYRPLFAKESLPRTDRYGKQLPPLPLEPDYKRHMESVLESCPRKPFYGSVMSIFLEEREAIIFVFVDRRGILRASGSIPQKLWPQQSSDLKKFIVENKPSVIIINSGGKQSAIKLERLLKAELIPGATKDIIEKIRDHRKRTTFNNNIDYEDEDDADEIFYDENKYDADVVIVDDDITRLLKQSSRVKRFFSESHPNVAAAITLARFVQEPLAEYANLWRSVDTNGIFGWESLNLNLHPLMELLRSKGVKQRAIVHLERALIDAVSAVGIDLNQALNEASGDHLMMMLSFTPGLGPRKAIALRDRISRLPNKAITSRRELLADNILGINVYNNAAGFLRVRNADFEDVDNVFQNSTDEYEEEENFDDFIDDDMSSKKKKSSKSSSKDRDYNPLDNTRIHPESYNSADYAIFICESAIKGEIARSTDENAVVLLMKSVKESLRQHLKKFKGSGYLENWHLGRPVEFEAQVIVKLTGELDTKMYKSELPDLLDKLKLDDYAQSLSDQNEGLYFMYFKFMKEELRFPFLDVRRPHTNLTLRNTPWKNFVSDTLGGNAEVYYPGLLVRCEFHAEIRNKGASVRTDSGHRAMIKASDFPFENGGVAGHSLKAVFLGYEYNATLGKFDIILSANPDHLKCDEVDWFGDDNLFTQYTKEWLELVRGVKCRDTKDFFGNYFSRSLLAALKTFRRAEMEVDKQTESSQTSSQPTPKQKLVRGFNRNVSHVLWCNCDHRRAEEIMATKPVGHILFRPSSHAVNFDRFTMVWKVSKTIHKYFEIFERDKSRGDPSLLGGTLIINDNGVNETFGSLDELYSQFARPLVDFTALIVENRKFASGTPEEVEGKLKDSYRTAPGFYYFIRHDPKRPGCFSIHYLVPDKNQAIQSFHEPIVVRHNGYYYREHERTEPYNSPDEICSQFKNDYKNNKLKAVKVAPKAPAATSRWSSASTSASSVSNHSASNSNSMAVDYGGSSAARSNSWGGGVQSMSAVAAGGDGGSSRHSTPAVDNWGSSRQPTPALDNWGGSSRHSTPAVDNWGGSRHSTPAVDSMHVSSSSSSNSRVINAPSLAGGGWGSSGQSNSSQSNSNSYSQQTQQKTSRWGNS